MVLLGSSQCSALAGTMGSPGSGCNEEASVHDADKAAHILTKARGLTAAMGNPDIKARNAALAMVAEFLSAVLFGLPASQLSPGFCLTLQKA